MMNKRISNSELQTFRTCRRKWWISNYRRLGLKQREYVGPASLGTDIHKCLEELYRHGTDPRETLASIKAAAYADTEEEGYYPFDVDKYEKQCELVEIMLSGFVEWAAETGLDAGMRTESIEQVLEVPVDFPKAESWSGVTLVGKLDQLVRREADGALLNRDWKSVGSLEEGRLTQHPQFKTYALIQKLSGQEGVLGAQRVMLKKVKRTGTAKPPYFGLDEAIYTGTNLRLFFQQVWGIVRDIAELTDRLDSGEDPQVVCYPHVTRACSWSCEFVTVCPMFDDGSDAEGFLKTFVERDPLDRYADDDKETS